MSVRLAIFVAPWRKWPLGLYRAATGAGSTVACSHAAVMQPAGLHNSSRAVIRLEYVEKHAKETGEQNARAQDGEVTRHIVQVTSCDASLDLPVLPVCKHVAPRLMARMTGKGLGPGKESEDVTALVHASSPRNATPSPNQRDSGKR